MRAVVAAAAVIATLTGLPVRPRLDSNSRPQAILAPGGILRSLRRRGPGAGGGEATATDLGRLVHRHGRQPLGGGLARATRWSYSSRTWTRSASGDRIRDDGTLELETRGGFILSLFEAKPALLHTDKGIVAGVFLPARLRLHAPHPSPAPCQRGHRFTSGHPGSGDRPRGDGDDAEAVRAPGRQPGERAGRSTTASARPRRSSRCGAWTARRSSTK